MGIPLNVDWQQILLHLFNFIILFGGLWLLLYKPVKNFMAKREAYYKDMDKAAAEKLAAAENEQQKYSGLIGKAQDEAAELKKKAMADADAAAKAHLDEAEQEKQRILADAKRAALAEKNKVLQEANAQIEEMVSAAVDKLLVPAGSAYDSFDSAEQQDIVLCKSVGDGLISEDSLNAVLAVIEVVMAGEDQRIKQVRLANDT